MYTDKDEYSPDDLDEDLRNLFLTLGEAKVMSEVHNGTSAKPGSELKMLILSIRYDMGLPMTHPADYIPYDRKAIEERRYNPYGWNLSAEDLPSTEEAAAEKLSEASEEDDPLPD